MAAQEKTISKKKPSSLFSVGVEYLHKFIAQNQITCENIRSTIPAHAPQII
jgi:hypothetical protein